MRGYPRKIPSNPRFILRFLSPLSVARNEARVLVGQDELDDGSLREIGKIVHNQLIMRVLPHDVLFGAVHRQRDGRGIGPCVEKGSRVNFDLVIAIRLGTNNRRLKFRRACGSARLRQRDGGLALLVRLHDDALLTVRTERRVASKDVVLYEPILTGLAR